MPIRPAWTLLFGLAVASLAAGQERQAPETRPAHLLADLVSQLGDDNYERREQAAKMLVEAGAAAIDALIEGLGSEQAEVSWRSSAALEQIAISSDEATLARVVKQLTEAAARTNRPTLTELAAGLSVRQKEFRRERAAARIRELGGRLAGPGSGEGEVDPFGAMAVFDGPLIVPAIAEPVPVELEAAAPIAVVEGVLPGLARAIFRALAPGGAAEDAPPEAETKPEEVGPPKGGDAKADAAAPGDAPGRAAKPDGEGEPAKDESKPPADAAEAADRAVEEAIKDAVAKAEAAAAEVAEARFDIAVGELIAAEAAIGESEPTFAAQLHLDRNWRGGDDALAALADLPEIWQVSLVDAPLSDKSLTYLAKLPRLQMLQIKGGKLSREGLFKFREKRPNCTVYCRGEAMLGVHADFGTSPLRLTSVMSGSGAAFAGLRTGDVIRELDGIKVRDFSDLTICVATRKVGDKVKVVYERDGKRLAAEVTLTRHREEY
jgi:hypothetical protein